MLEKVTVKGEWISESTKILKRITNNHSLSWVKTNATHRYSRGRD